MDTETDRVKLTDLASCGGCAAKYSAARLEQLLAGFVPGRGREPARRARSRRRRRGVPARRRTRAHLHARLLPSGRRRRSRLRRHRRDQRAQRRLRHGRHAIARALDRGLPGRAADARCSPRSSPRPTSRSALRVELLAGGHTIRDAEPKYGLAVVGTVHPDGIWPKNGAKPGDAIFLTKPLGTGLIMTGYKRGHAGEHAARARDPLDADAEQGRGRRAAGRSSPTPSPTSRASGCSATRTRSPTAAASASDSSRSGFPRSTARSTSPAKACARAAIPATATSLHGTSRRDGCRRRSTRWATTRRRRAACSSRSRRSAAPRSRPSSTSRQALHSQDRPRGGGRRRLRRVTSRDDPRAVPALPQRPPRVPARRGRAVRRGVRRDHEPRSEADQARRAERPAAAPARVEPVQLRRAAADGRGGRGGRGDRARARDPVSRSTSPSSGTRTCRAGVTQYHPALLGVGRDEARADA